MRKYGIEVYKTSVVRIEVESDNLDSALKKAEEYYETVGIDPEDEHLYKIEYKGSSIDVESTMKLIRDKNIGMKEFSSGYAPNDKEVPYVFDLLYDIKTEAHLLNVMQGYGIDNYPISEVQSLAAEYGYSFKYLEDKFSKVGLISAYIEDDKTVVLEQQNSEETRTCEFDNIEDAEDFKNDINSSSIWKYEDLPKRK